MYFRTQCIQHYIIEVIEGKERDKSKCKQEHTYKHPLTLLQMVH